MIRRGWQGFPGGDASSPAETGMTRRWPNRLLPARLLAAALAFLCSAGCVSRVHAPYSGPADDRPPMVRQASLDASGPRPRAAVLMEPIGRQGTHDLYSIAAPSVGCNGQDGGLVTGTLYRSTAPGRHRLVIVLPIWGKSNYPQRQIVRWLTRRHGAGDTHVLEVHGEWPILDWDALAVAPTEARFFELIDRGTGCFLDIATDVRRLVGWAERLDGVDPGRIGLVGFSLGAVVGSLAMGQDERLAAGVFVMGGADLHETFASCRGRAQRVREQVGERFGWTQEEFRQRLVAPLAAANPARFAANIHPSRVLVVDAAYDTCMPEKSRNAFWEALGRPERITLSYGHQVAFVSMSRLFFRYTTRRIAGFLDRRLSAETVPAPRTPPPALSSVR